VATLVRTIVDALGRHRGHSLSSNGSPRRWLGSCLRMAEHLEQARFDLVALAHFRSRALVPDLEYQPFEERLHKEIRRRTDVVGIFQGRVSRICLVGSLLMGETEEWAERCSMSARGPCQGPTGTVPRRRPRHGTRPPGVADGERIECGSHGGQ